ncbi:hypothetical protein EWZ91_06635 [Helicobacter pylori]|uniref:hypothetical protein n=1 Tax=Helicobacter pylori TaxID=210 RepID=UPI0009A324A1|nr:hypothetical protein [Helicobacter pylori]MBH0260695.1 hypothetical protein [Helicobacter pylori]MBH0262093.1 hypothetical protein [Helicobacter pylori]MBH0289005.1 hypothetical protein [Helicobacter pylori]NHA73120.1 hypothetical protein [Helicobacter pylori]OPG21166.1 hypothetical protein BGL62_04715 [Helicobacter pylori]
MTINTHYAPNFTQLQTLNNINNDATIKDRNQVEQDLQQSSIQDGFSQNNTQNAPDFDRLQVLNAINNDGGIKDKSQVEKSLADGGNVPEIYSSLDAYA